MPHPTKTLGKQGTCQAGPRDRFAREAQVGALTERAAIPIFPVTCGFGTERGPPSQGWIPSRSASSADSWELSTSRPRGRIAEHCGAGARPAGVCGEPAEETLLSDRCPSERTLPTFWTSAVAVVLVGAVFIGSGAGQEDLRRDEVHFWPTSLKFGETFPPSLETLTDYGELNTPLAFAVFGWLDALTGGGVVAGRALNTLCALTILCMILLRDRRVTATSAFAAAGLVIYPYFLGASVHVYSDTIAALFALIGVMGFQQGRHGRAGLAFALGISTRQYVVAFPLACLGRVLLRREEREPWPIVAYLLSALSLVAWFVVFGGFAPRSALAREAPATADLWYVRPQHALYFLACLGLYFGVVEAVLFRRLISWRSVLKEQPVRFPLVALGLAALFVAFPPLGNVRYGIAEMGLLDVGARRLLPEPLRIPAFFALALVAGWRFHRMDLAGLLVCVHAVLMLKAHIAWDKYALPLLVVLWYLRGSPVENEADLRTSTRSRTD